MCRDPSINNSNLQSSSAQHVCVRVSCQISQGGGYCRFLSIAGQEIATCAQPISKMLNSEKYTNTGLPKHGSTLHVKTAVRHTGTKARCLGRCLSKNSTESLSQQGCCPRALLNITLAASCSCICVSVAKNHCAALRIFVHTSLINYWKNLPTTSGYAGAACINIPAPFLQPPPVNAGDTHFFTAAYMAFTIVLLFLAVGNRSSKYTHVWVGSRWRE